MGGRARHEHGVVAGGIGLAVYMVWESRAAAIAVTLGTYALADWLGLLPAPFVASMHDMLHSDDTQPSSQS